MPSRLRILSESTCRKASRRSGKTPFVPTDNARIGDVNYDGTISVADVTEIQKHIAELDAFTDAQLDAADTNGDGVTDISDATRLQEYIAEYPVILGRQTDD